MRKEKSPSTHAAKSTKLTGDTDKSCLTLSTDIIMKSDITPDSVGSALAANTDNAVNSVNGNNSNTVSNPATLFTDEQTAQPQPKQQRIGSKQRRLDFGEYKASYLAPVKIENRHSLNISNATWERLERVARILGDRGANVGSYAERILSEHLDAYADDIEAWRKL